MAPTQTQGIGHQKYPTYVHCSAPSPKFVVPFALRNVFKILHIYKFPIDSYVKISKCHKIFKFCRSPIYTITFYSRMTTLFIIKFSSDRMKTEGVAFYLFIYFLLYGSTAVDKTIETLTSDILRNDPKLKSTHLTEKYPICILHNTSSPKCSLFCSAIGSSRTWTLTRI